MCGVPCCIQLYKAHNNKECMRFASKALNNKESVQSFLTYLELYMQKFPSYLLFYMQSLSGPAPFSEPMVLSMSRYMVEARRAAPPLPR